MNKHLLLWIFVAGLMAAACQKTGVAAPAVTQPGENTPGGIITDSASKLRYTGMFVQGAEGTVAGKAGVYTDTVSNWLVLDSFSVTPGPDLHVYLAKELPPIHFIDLGKLKATMGRQVYAVSGMPNYGDYAFAVIHCQQYNVVFGSAQLK